MVNTPKLKGRITEMGLTIQKIAEQKNMSAYTLGKKISNKAAMTLDDADFLQNVLSIPDSEFMDYFFIREVAKCNLAY